MATPMRLDGILAKIESTYGTDSTPTDGTDGVRINDRAWTQMGLEYAFDNHLDDAANGSLIPPAPAGRHGRIANLDIPWLVRGAGVAYGDPSPVPEADPLIRSCAMAATISEGVGTENVLYEPTDQNLESCTIYAYAGAKRYRIVGCRGSFELQLRAGQLAIMRFRMRGFINTDPDELTLPAVTYDAVVPPASVSAAATIDTFQPDWSEITLNQNAEPNRIDSGNEPTGVLEFQQNLITPRCSIRCITVPLGAIGASQYDPYADLKAGTVRTIDQTLGSTQYNQLKVQNASATLRNITHEDYESMTAWMLEYSLTDFDLLFD
jgi:hypothetical protein